MGYELNKLMKQYGVSTPGMTPYTGPAKNAEAMQQYNQYRTDYMDRVASAPMYGEEQYLTGLAGERATPTYASPIMPPKFDSTTGTDTTEGDNQYDYDYLENTQEELEKIEKFKTGPNAKARAGLIELYSNTLNRLPDESGFEYYLNKFGGDDEISPEERAEFLGGAEKELGQLNELKSLYGKYAGREADIPGLEYWMGEIGRFGGVDPIRDRFLEGIQKEVGATNFEQAQQRNNFGTTTFQPGMYEVNTKGATLPGATNQFNTPAPSFSKTTFQPGMYEVNTMGATLPGATNFEQAQQRNNFGTTTFQPGMHEVNTMGATLPRATNQFWEEALAKKYNVGGVVRKFRLGGDEGEPEDPIESIVRERSIAMGGMPPKDQGEPEGLIESIAREGFDAARARSNDMGGMPPKNDVGPAQSITRSPATQPVTPPPSATTPVSPAATDLMAMLANYGAGEDVYGPELKTARAKVSSENEKFAKMIETAMKGESAVPDKTELYFRLASAFGAPSRTGAFTENLSMVGKEAAEYAKDVRAAQRADKQLRMNLGLEAQKLRAQGAREDLSTLRTLAGEEMKDKRSILTEYIKSGRPQSEAGKAAIDAGLKQGTPEFQTFVNDYIDQKIRSGNLFKEAMVSIAAGNLQVGRQRADIAQRQEQRQEASAAKLTPAEIRLKAEAETTLGGIDDAMSSLKRAYSLNPNTFDGTLIALAQRKILEQTNPKDPRVLATREQQNLISKGAIDKLRASFGGNPTEGERAALLALEGIDSKSKEERAQIMKNTYKLLQARRQREQKRLDEISKGAYRETTPTTGELE